MDAYFGGGGDEMSADTPLAHVRVRVSSPRAVAIDIPAAALGATGDLDPLVRSIVEDVIEPMRAPVPVGWLPPPLEESSALAKRLAASATPGQVIYARAVMRAHRQIAQYSYAVREGNSFAGVPARYLTYTFAPQASTREMKFFYRDAGLTNTNHLSIVFAFAGTDPGRKGDIGRDAQSQIPAWHYNPLNGRRALTVAVASGFQTRWVNQATNRGADRPLDGVTVEARLRDAIHDLAGVAGVNPRLYVDVVGHSLGGAVSQIAAYSISDFLRDAHVNHGINVYAFNPPSVGFNRLFRFADASDWYKGPLVEGNADCVDTSPDAAALQRGYRCIVMHQFTRTNDQIVNHVPLFGKHPVWTKTGLAKTGSKRGDAALRYCPMLVGRRLSLNPFGNHDLDAWEWDIANANGNAVECMFRFTPP
jgi:hypothetical protein